jgi:hypothetical protein
MTQIICKDLGTSPTTDQEVFVPKKVSAYTSASTPTSEPWAFLDQLLAVGLSRKIIIIQMQSVDKAIN